MMTRALAFLAALLLSSPAFAGSATVNYSSSGSSPFRTTTDGSSNNIGEQTIWDSAAGANGLAITTNNAAKTEGVGSAGTAAGGVVTVQGVASMVPLLAAQSGTWNITNISGTISLPTGASTAALQGTNSATTTHTCSTGGFSELGCLGQIDDDVKSSIAAGSATIGNVGVITPAGATVVQGSTTGTTAATSTTLAATASVTNYVCEISIRANATAAATGNATLSDGTKTFNFTQWTAPNASGVGVIEEIFNPCYPASAVNTAWTLTSAAPGTGGVVSVAIAGYQK